ncbi:MAG: C25 family cysteine peptidase [Crenarchaeota archaeon]|nr:C25 family cysteine peptidase [Thermoproteota archaeon]
MAGPDRPGKNPVPLILIVIIVFTGSSPLKQAVAETPAGYDLLVIGPESYRRILQVFLDFKAAQGIKAKFYPIERISANATGRSIAERLHEFIVEEYSQSGFKYLLLVGTYEHVPTRYVYSPSDELGLADFNYKPSDWYYGVPDWNDFEVGLLGGNIPKIAVGRLPVRNEEELDRLIKKIIRVEADFQPGLLLVLKDQAVNVDSLLDALRTCSPLRVNTTPSVLDTSFLKNVTYLVTITHGSQNALFTGTPDGELKTLITADEASRIVEGYAIHYIAACFAGALDLEGESLARVLVTTEGGPALVIASSRTEWSGNPILPVFWKRFFATGDVGQSFLDAVETYLLDANVFSPFKPSFSSYNFYLNKAIYGDVSWRIKNPVVSITDLEILANSNTHMENGFKNLSNVNPVEKETAFTRNIIILLLVAFLIYTFTARSRLFKRGSTLQ